MSTLHAHADFDANAARPSFLARNHFLLRRLHSLTGVAFGGFLLFHLTINATLIEGTREIGTPTVFQQLVTTIHLVPFLGAVSWTLLLFPIIFHTIYGIYITYTGQPNVGSYGYTRNWLYIFQRVSAVFIMVFLTFHVLTMKGWIGGGDGTLRALLRFEPLYATASVSMHLQAAWWIGWVIYPIGVLASTFHLANGFYTAAITWGLTISSTAQKRWGILCVFVFLGSFAAGMTALVAGLTVSLAESEQVVRAVVTR